MARINKIVRDNPLSNFQQAAPPVGGAFALLADMASAAYDRLAPAAVKEQEALGAELGREIARGQIGNPGAAFTMSSMGGSAPSVPVNADGVVQGLVARGMPQHIAEGFALNFQDESAFNPNAVGDGGNAFGLAQWNGPRKASLEAFAASRGASPGDVDTQLDFLMSELQGSEASAWAKIQQAQDRGSAAAAILNHFERPAEVHRARREAAYLGGGNVTMSTSGQPVAMVREADGALTARLYSPLSGEILQAHNAAAGVAYISEMMVKGQADIMGMSEQFNLNPEGFSQAAQGYVDDIVQKAPEQFQADLRAELSDQVQRRLLGMVEERQSETRQRAANSNQALIDLWTDNLASASVAGDLNEISKAEVKLGAALRARETLPGLSWTPEQSANVIRRAREEGARRVQDQRQRQADTIKSDLQLALEAAKAGRASANEAAVLNNPLAQSLHPELYAEALAFTTLRDEMPSFMALPPQQQAAAIKDMQAQPMRQDWETALLGAAEKAQTANAKAWKDDPVQRASEVLPVKPPPLPTFDPNNPQAFINGLAGRAAYGRDLAAKGYTDIPAFLTNAEATGLGAMMGRDTPPEVKAAMAGAIVTAFGEDAARVFTEIKSDDPVLKMSGMLMARGGDPNVATAAIRGQAMLDEGLVSAPAKGATVAAVSPDIAAALTTVPLPAQGDLMKMATAIYATQVPPNADEATQKAAMEGAIQTALGQSTNRRGQTTGGVQTIGGNPVLLPPGVAADEVQAGLDKAFGGDASGVGLTEVARDSFVSALTFGLAGGDSATGARRPDASIWAKAGIGASANSVPMMAGKPMDPTWWSKGYVSLVPVGGNTYRLEVRTGSSVLYPRNASGSLYQFDVTRLLDDSMSQVAPQDQPAIGSVDMSGAM